MKEQDKGSALKLLVYDDTCKGGRAKIGLTHSWWLGGSFYRRIGRFDGVCAAHSWREALDFLIGFEAARPIGEIQFWGHGKWGEARIARDILDISSLQETSPLYAGLQDVAARMQGPQSRFWFRTCETFGAEKGHAFASAFSTFMNCLVAGHTYIIGPWQSGLHCIKPGETPDWPVEEGVREGTPGAPTRAFWSRPGRGRTITCLQDRIPNKWISPN
jgi:hypothetical protein